MVAIDPQTWDKDVAGMEPGGYLFYDSTKPMPASKFRDDIFVIGVPLTAIANREYTDPRQRQLFKNIIYLGALSALLGIEPDVIEALFLQQSGGCDAPFLIYTGTAPRSRPARCRGAAAAPPGGE